MYYNTNGLCGHKLRKAIAKCSNQEQRILTIMRKLKKKLTASQLHEIYIDLHNKRTPLTSIRRALSNLKNEEVIHKLDEQRIGDYGMPEHFYSLKKTA